MTFTAYIQRQKSLIRARHTGETFLICGDSSTPLRCVEELFSELDELKGLNKAERAGVFSVKRGERALV